MKRTHAALAIAAVVGVGALGAATALAHDPQGDWRGGRNGYAMMDRMEMMMKQRGMMGPMMVRHGARGGCDGAGMAKLATPLTVKDVTAQLEKRLEWRGNKRLKVGKVEMTKDKNIVAEIVTVDGSLVRKIEVDPSTGMRHPVN
ncbi:hypothetical protein [Varunaivibrio sulfuroxidans]|uniref:YpeB-like protein with protease inhibitory function n=1 Tax=Varunaivibrio sulfuroxidans TaxID=1773489 RepID=A0A4R3J7H9_9PROT|nr:hypothetical protein [Varunaivibrio sulfuroxidans]TCS60853.1 hypothetical protein EDD55_10913 [Varunaivibrio sulfuroxidans]WES31733.1 hypothetical protein P3M64_05020 [Varunaivibrio sulfuroxidans]